MSGVILVIDEVIDQGIVMHTNPTVILQRIKSTQPKASGIAAAVKEE